MFEANDLGAVVLDTAWTNKEGCNCKTIYRIESSRGRGKRLCESDQTTHGSPRCWSQALWVLLSTSLMHEPLNS